MATLGDVLANVPLPPLPCSENSTFDVQIMCVDGSFVGLVTVSGGLPPEMRAVKPACGCKDTEVKTELLAKLAEGKWTPAEVNELARTLFPR